MQQSNTQRVVRARLVAVGALIGTSSLVLAGCAGGSDEGSTSGGTLTVQVQSVQQPAFEYAAGIFEDENPGVKVEFQTVTEQQKSTTNSQIMASSNAPDIGLVPVNAQPYFDLVKADALEPLDDLWADADLEARYGDVIASSLKWNDTPYLALFDTTFYNVVYYNKDAFAEAGVAAPENHQIASNEDLYDIVSKLEDAGYDGVAAGGAAGYQLGWLLDAQLQANAPEALEDYLVSWQPGAQPTMSYEDPEFTDSLAQIGEWNEKGVFQEGMAGAAGDQAQAAFTAGDAAMLLGGSWIPSILGDVDFEYDWLLLPGAGDEPTLPSLFAGDTLAIPKTSKNIDLAKKFLAIYSSDDVQTYAAENVGSLPAVNTVAASDLPGLGPVVQSVVEFTTTVGFGLGWTSTLPGSLGGSFIDPQIQQLVSGQTTAEQIGQAEQSAFDTWKSQND
ncbi:raffinose/stachyose/melibiose transport system substrate-binding protein [Microbacterium foliorum]|uniref:ABC transporter substrate-binding protein n=1 Tax=Microbacterium foliorum TaxID=104336 RepID=UPI00209D0E2D|nr:extracellular solute-binding protein [Microbacterium foliorum]MCP1428169.1 raffinose/stachyose/melibiose transport system substrate-binding protein [Microbacterium foliorum]